MENTNKIIPNRNLLFMLYFLFVFLSVGVNGIIGRVPPPGDIPMPASCYSGTNYTKREIEQFQRNLNSLLSILNNESSTAKYRKATVGSSPDKAYASFLCRYDLPQSVCHDCVTNITEFLQTKCLGYLEAPFYPGVCAVHFANHSSFSRIDLTHSYPFCLFPSLNDKALNQSVKTMISGLIDNVTSTTAAAAPGAGLANYFAIGESRYMIYQTLHALVQCSPDINSSDCRECLRAAVDQALYSCQVSIGASCSFGNCMVMYSLYHFDHNRTRASWYTNNSTILAAPQPLPLPLLPDTPSSSPSLRPDISINPTPWIVLHAIEIIWKR